MRMGMDLLSGRDVPTKPSPPLRQALAKDADNPRAHFALGVARLSQGQMEEAKRLYAEGGGAVRQEGGRGVRGRRRPQESHRPRHPGAGRPGDTRNPLAGAVRHG